MRYLLQAGDAPRKKDLKKAQRHFNAAARLSRASKDTAAEAANLNKAGETALQLKKNFEAVVCLMRACKLLKKQGAGDMLYESSGLLYKALQRYKTRHPRKAGKIDRRLEKIRQESADIFRTRYRETLREDAHYVAQGMAGFSSSAPLGTENICDCVCLILRDPVSKRTALAHIDAATTAKSLENIFARMPQTDGLEAKIIGARYGASNTTDDYVQQNGRRNIKIVTDILRDKNVNILSCDLCAGDQPLAITVDPASFDVREELCGQRRINAYFGDSLACFIDKKDLQVAFDLDRAEDHHPVYVPAGAYGRIHEFALKSPDEIYFDLSTWMHPNALPSSIETRIRFVECHLQERKPLIAAAEAAMRAATKKGLSFDDEFAVYKMIHQAPLYVGIGAEAANDGILSFIKNDLFLKDDGGKWRVNKEGFERAISAMHPEKLWPADKTAVKPVQPQNARPHTP
jgi:chemotaxis receptor (MCP) glutamine deamidase CheD